MIELTEELVYEAMRKAKIDQDKIIKKSKGDRMDPRHPELAVSRIKELIEQYDRIEKDMAKANTSAQLGQLEREGGLVVQEICLVAPRIHEAMMQTSRQRRYELSHGIVEKPVEKDVNKNEEKVDIEEPDVNEKPKKNTTRKKKTAKKADK